MNDLISIILPVYNVEKYLDTCLTSIVNQTYKNFEIIIVNDGSTDNSKRICEKYKCKYNFIKMINKQNAGLGEARNTGLSYVSGKYVIFIDSDDYIEPNMVENLYMDMVNNNVDTVIGGFTKVWANKKYKNLNMYAGKKICGNDLKKFVLPKMFANNGKGHIEMSVWKTIFSHSIIKSNNIRFPDRSLISEDIIFDIQYFSYAQSVFFSENCGYCYRFNPNSLSQGYRKDKFELLKHQMITMKSMSNEYKLPKECILNAEIYLLGNTIHYIKQIVNYYSNDSKIAKQKILEIANDQVLGGICWEQTTKSYDFRKKTIAFLIKEKKVQELFYFIKFLNHLTKIIKRG